MLVLAPGRCGANLAEFSRATPSTPAHPQPIFSLRGAGPHRCTGEKTARDNLPLTRGSALGLRRLQFEGAGLLSIPQLPARVIEHPIP